MRLGIPGLAASWPLPHLWTPILVRWWKRLMRMMTWKRRTRSCRQQQVPWSRVSIGRWGLHSGGTRFCYRSGSFLYRRCASNGPLVRCPIAAGRSNGVGRVGLLSIAAATSIACAFALRIREDGIFFLLRNSILCVNFLQWNEFLKC